MTHTTDGENAAGERITVNLSRAGTAALGLLVEGSGKTKTEVVNQALQLFALIQDVQNSGGKVLFRDGTGDLERLHLVF